MHTNSLAKGIIREKLIETVLMFENQKKNVQKYKQKS